MVKTFNINKASFLLALLLFSILCKAQIFKQETLYPEFKKFATWGISLNGVMYDKAKSESYYGTYTMQNHPITSYALGFVKLIHPEHKFSFKTGFQITVTPLTNYSAHLKKEDVYPEYNINEGYDLIQKKNVSRPAINIPLLVQFKKQMAKNIYFNLETGFNCTLLLDGRFDGAEVISSESLQESREIFAVYGENNYRGLVYPNLVLSPGFYFMFNKFMIQTNFIYQNSIPNYYKGEYQFGNLLQSGPSRGSYKLSGDYIGLVVNFHLKKSEKKLIREGFYD